MTKVPKKPAKKSKRKGDKHEPPIRTSEQYERDKAAGIQRIGHSVDKTEPKG